VSEKVKIWRRPKCVVAADCLYLGLSAATFDSEYQARRRMTQRRNRPRHAMYASRTFSPSTTPLISLQTRYGVTAGGEALASSVASAMEGVVVSTHLSCGKFFLVNYPCFADEANRGRRIRGRIGLLQRNGEGPCWVC
jgi:predicted alpha/beta-hydrolase family hydrolase